LPGTRVVSVPILLRPRPVIIGDAVGRIPRDEDAPPFADAFERQRDGAVHVLEHRADGPGMSWLRFWHFGSPNGVLAVALDDDGLGVGQVTSSRSARALAARLKYVHNLIAGT
jgi:hypothetical protein